MPGARLPRMLRVSTTRQGPSAPGRSWDGARSRSSARRGWPSSVARLVWSSLPPGSPVLPRTRVSRSTATEPVASSIRTSRVTSAPPERTKVCPCQVSRGWGAGPLVVCREGAPGSAPEGRDGSAPGSTAAGSGRAAGAAPRAAGCLVRTMNRAPRGSADEGNRRERSGGQHPSTVRGRRRLLEHVDRPGDDQCCGGQGDDRLERHQSLGPPAQRHGVGR